MLTLTPWRGGVVVAVATVLGIADAGGEAAGHLDLVVGHVGDPGVVVHARAALVAVVGAGRVLLQGRVIEVAHRRLRQRQVQAGRLRRGGAGSGLGQHGSRQGQAQQQGQGADHDGAPADRWPRNTRRYRPTLAGVA
ncbi:hypothetical protein G6F31_019166 [Rhizopus arrhizus]|nr:hypothetical protein G6F31_019166 [Rhizopus arrhizus]